MKINFVISVLLLFLLHKQTENNNIMAKPVIKKPSNKLKASIKQGFHGSPELNSKILILAKIKSVKPSEVIKIATDEYLTKFHDLIEKHLPKNSA